MARRSQAEIGPSVTAAASCRLPQTMLIGSLLWFFLSPARVILFSQFLLSSFPHTRQYLWAIALIALPTLPHLTGNSYGQD